jgi:hypothetical protein
MIDEAPPFQLDLISTHGLELASAAQIGDCFGVHEWTSWLRIRSEVSGYVPSVAAPDDDDATSFVPPVFERDGLAVLVVTRSFEDLTGATVGLFYMRLDTNTLAEIRKTVEQTPWVDLPRPIGGSYTAPNIRLHYANRASPGFVVQRAFNGACGNFIEAINPLWRLLATHSDRVFTNASATLRMSLSANPTPADPNTWQLTLTLRNLGRDAVVLTDPRVPSPDGAAPRLDLQFGDDPGDPTWPMVRTTPIPAPSLPADAPDIVTLAHRQRLEIEIPWQPPRPGNYRILATWQDYRGPLEAAPGQIPFMPLPQSGPPYFGSGPYPIRGALFSRVDVEVPAPAPTRR